MMMNFNNFDKEFKKTEKRMFKAFWLVIIFNTIYGIGIFAGFGLLVYLLLKHFGIVG